ncbi:MAG: extracellular solute-binding protein, partial [Clostridia bacterium]
MFKLKKRFCLLLICALMLVSFLAPLSGCTKNNQPVLRVYNWGDYIGPDVISDFEKETGIKVEYSMFETNEQMYMKLKKGAASSYDVVIPSDYMIRKMINENMLEKLDMTKIPNYSLIDDKFKNLAFDAKNEY